jgi:signal transduction histidine kinase
VNRRHALFLDAAVPALVAAVILAASVLHAAATVRPLAVVLSIGAAASLAARRRVPGWTLAVSGALVAIVLHLDRSVGTVAVIAPAVALYSLALTRGRGEQLLAGVAAVVAVIVADISHSGVPTLLQTLGHVLLIALPLLAAEAMRAHRSYLSVALERIELAELTRQQESERRAEQERIRIARELHDVVAHTLTTITVQAGAAAEQLPAGDARSALETIEDTSRDAIAELRAILGVLRDPDQSNAPRAPAPGVHNVAELVDRARDAGHAVELTITGEPPSRLSDAVSLAAYRIVQESLTNARRHAEGADVRVGLEFDPARLSLAIANGTGTAANASANGGIPGVGIIGMRERAAAIGGTLRAGPLPDGFRVDATLPYELHR